MKVHACRHISTGIIIVYLHTNGLFNDPVSGLDYMAPNG
jgi:hypothetical protein